MRRPGHDRHGAISRAFAAHRVRSRNCSPLAMAGTGAGFPPGAPDEPAAGGV